LWTHLSALDHYRRRFDSPPDSLTNAILLGTLLAPRGYTGRRPIDDSASDSIAGGVPEGPGGRHHARRREWRDPKASLGILPLARRDIERLQQIFGLQRRLRDMHSSPRAQRALLYRGVFREALTWLEIHGAAPDLVVHWQTLIDTVGPSAAATGDQRPPFRRRRRRYGRGRHRPARIE
jgi:hypothetical protein